MDRAVRTAKTEKRELMERTERKVLTASRGRQVPQVHLEDPEFLQVAVIRERRVLREKMR